MFPTADQVATAIVLAARLHGEDALSVARGGGGNRGRTIAYCALVEAFPDIVKAKISRWCGFPSQSAASAHLIHARKSKWWSEDQIDEIVGAVLVGDEESGSDCDPSTVRRSAEVARTEGEDTPREAKMPMAHFERDERRIIAQMWNGGASPVTIAAALGAEADEIRAFAKANPQLCAERADA